VVLVDAATTNTSRGSDPISPRNRWKWGATEC
jgi:hypothetical protein